MTAAGLDGIERKADPGEPGSGNLLEDAKYVMLPTTMIDAVEAFEKDGVLTDALGKEFAHVYAALLRYVWKRFLSYVTDWEIQEYRDLL
jgi:glutamine synthetase